MSEPKWTRRWRGRSVPALVGLSAAVVIASGPWVSLPWGVPLVAAALAAVACPGLLAVDALVPDRRSMDRLERAVFASAAGVAHAVVSGLTLVYLPGPLTAPRLAIGYAAGILIWLVVATARGAVGHPVPVGRRIWLAAAAVLLVGLLFRLPAVGWSEFQGDEAIVMAKAAAALDGRDDAVLIHKKGPAEIVTVAQVYALQGRIDETRARLPFAAVMVLGLVALFALGRHLFGTAVGAVAAGALGFNGFFIGFGRIVQYQSVVFLLSTVALYAMWRARWADGTGHRHRASGAPSGAVHAPAPPGAHRDGTPDPAGGVNDRGGGWILLSAFLLAAGLLAHYDAGLVAPAMLWLLVRRWRGADRPVAALRSDLRAVGGGVLVGTIILGAFYVPLVRHPYFASTTLPYLTEVRLGGGDEAGLQLFHNTLQNSASLASFYNPALALLVVAGLLLVALHLRLRAAWSARVAVIAPVGVALLGTALLLRPSWFQWGPVDVSIALVVAVGLLAFVPRGASEGWRAVWLWLMVPVVFYATMVESPRTHFHVAFPPWYLLAAVPVVAGWRAADRGRATAGHRPPAAAIRTAIAIAVLAWTVYSGIYAWHAFLRVDVEYKRGWPETRLPGYWMPYPQLPSSGWFGFPYRAGWKTVGALYGEDVLEGDYHSNEEEPVTAWYTRGQPRCDDEPRIIFVAEDVQDVREIPDDLEAAGYGPVGAVETLGSARIVIWRWHEDGVGTDGGIRTPVRYVDPATARAPATAPGLLAPDDAGVGSGRVWPPRAALPPMDEQTAPFGQTFDRRLSGPHYDRHLPYGDPLATAEHPMNVPFGDVVRLRGWRIEGSTTTDDAGDVIARVPPGGRLVVSLWWQAAAPIETDFSVFAHVEREGEAIAGQDDGAPRARDPSGVCGGPHPMTRWEPGEAHVDRRVIEIGSDAAPGVYELLVGLYDYETLDRLPVLNAAGQPTGNRVRLAQVRVLPPDGAGTDRDPDGTAPSALRYGRSSTNPGAMSFPGRGSDAASHPAPTADPEDHRSDRRVGGRR